MRNLLNYVLKRSFTANKISFWYILIKPLSALSITTVAVYELKI